MADLGGSRVICVSHNHLLLVFHDDKESGESWWVPPGGGREEGETFEEAAVREVFEETGIQIMLLRQLAVPDRPATRALFVGKAVEFKPASPTVDIQHERLLSEARWWSIDATNPLGPLDPTLWDFIADVVIELLDKDD